MDDMLGLLAWAAIGMAVSMATMVLPFRRGAVGVAANMLSSLVGAVGGGFLGLALGVYQRWAAPVSFVFAAATAIAVTMIMHVIMGRKSQPTV